MTFTADYPGSIVYPAHPNNYGGYGRGNTPKAIVLHTPEEPADNNEITPQWFAQPSAGASTHYYLDNDGDMFQMVSEDDCPWANGNRGGVNRTWKGVKDAWPPWAEAGVSLNCQTISIEIEGYAASIGQTLNDTQFNVLVTWIKDVAERYSIPLDRDHIIGHFEVATDRTDPGSTFPWDRLMAALNEAPAIDMTKIRIVPLDGVSEVRWTNAADEREIATKFDLSVGGDGVAAGEVVSRVRIVVDQ